MPTCIAVEVEDANLRLLNKQGVEELQLSAQGLVVADRVRGSAIDDMHERARSLAVTQKLVAEAHTSMRSLQQAWNKNAQPKSGHMVQILGTTYRLGYMIKMRAGVKRPPERM